MSRTSQMPTSPELQTPLPKWSIVGLLKPHSKAFAFGLIAVIGESIASLLEPWPLKIVLDNILKSKPAHGWLNTLIVSLAGADSYAILRLAAIMVLVIAVIDAVCTYTEKYFTTS